MNPQLETTGRIQHQADLNQHPRATTAFSRSLAVRES
jgi:hypothetical protein